jgi:hypothetical protein
VIQKNMKKFAYASLMFLFPIVTLAQTLNFNNLMTPLAGLKSVMDKIIPLIIGAAVIVFLWGVLKYVLSGADDPDKRKEARGFMVWGIVALFVMVSVWGLVKILQTTTGITNTSNSGIGYPTTPGGN